MPVPAVSAGGRPTVSSGSRITCAGIIPGWKITFLVRLATLVMTPARPTSDPVPAVVGTATIGAIPAGSARVHQSPTSSKSHIGSDWPRIKAMTFPQSIAEPPPKATTPSWPPSRSTASPAATLASVGFARTSEKTAAGRPAAARMPSARSVIGRRATPGSVTRRGRAIRAAAQASASSSTRPAPKRIAVG